MRHFVFELQTLTLMLDLILLLMVSGVEGLSIPSLLLESSTLMHHLIIHLRKSAYCRHEKKRRQYEQHVREIEHNRFTPFIFATTGEWAMLQAKFTRD